MSQSTKNAYRLSEFVIPVYYKLFLKPNFEDFTFMGEEEINIEISKPTTQVILNSADIVIKDVSIDSKGRKISGKVSYNEKYETATFTFPKKLEEGKYALKILFEGIISDK